MGGEPAGPAGGAPSEHPCALYSVSMGSSVMGGHDEVLQVLKEKMRLEGQLESLSSEANQVRVCPAALCQFTGPVCMFP